MFNDDDDDADDKMMIRRQEICLRFVCLFDFGIINIFLTMTTIEQQRNKTISVIQFVLQSLVCVRVRVCVCVPKNIEIQNQNDCV